MSVSTPDSNSFQQKRCKINAAKELHRYRWFCIFILLPTISAVLYCLLASDRYVSEAQFVVRSATADQQSGALSSILKSAGLAASDDGNIVKAFIKSPSAVDKLEGMLPLKNIYNAPQADFITRWPSVIYGKSEGEFYDYYRTMVSIELDQETDILSLKVDAFSPLDAQKIASSILALSEQQVNQINDRMEVSKLQAANDDVKRNEALLEESKVALTTFRNREMTFDPEKNAVMLTELIGSLSTQLAEVQTRIDEILHNIPDSPQLSVLQYRQKSLQKQIQSQQDEVSAAGSGLADKVAQYERLKLQDELAMKRLTASIATLTVAQTDTHRQRLFLERVSEPTLPDDATQPRRVVIVMTVFGWSCLIYLVVWFFVSGLREHEAGA